MRYFTFHNLFLALMLSSTPIFSSACLSKVETSEPIVEIQQTPKKAKEIRPCKNEPVYSPIPNDAKTKNMQAAWKQFIASGQYRLACDSDGDFALDVVEPKTIKSYSIDKQDRSVATWGMLNYPRRAYEDHLIAIVVDTTRNDPNRFGIVIFSPPQTKKNAYEVNWLYKDRDLSRASVGKASGSVSVEDYSSEGKKSICWIGWNRRKGIFECKDDPL